MRTFLLVLALIAIASFPFVSNWYYGVRKDSYQTSQIESVIEQYIAKNPEKILDAVNQYRLAQFEEQQKQKVQKMKEAIVEYKDELFDAGYPSFKADKEKITVVEFFDASCGYCKLASQMLLKLKQDYPNATYILRNLPILGQSSVLAAKYDVGFFLFAKEKRLPIAKYSEFHSELMSHRDEYTQEVFSKIISKVGISPKEVENFLDKNEAEISTMIEKTVKLAHKLHLEGTPAFIVGEQIVQGASEVEMREILEKVAK